MKQAAVLLLGVALLIFLALMVPWTPMGWHLEHGSSVRYGGFVFHLPAAWYAKTDPEHPERIEFDKPYSMLSHTPFNETDTINVETIAGAAPRDMAWAQRWQQSLRRISGNRPETVQAHGHTLLCIDSGPIMSVHTDANVDLYMMSCVVVGTPVIVEATGASSTMRETRAMALQAF